MAISRYDMYRIAKLTLSVDPMVVSRAKRLAKARGTSLSRIVESYLRAMSEEADGGSDQPPILRSLRGILKTADFQDYRRHLASKYG
jgi:hypothetical protein